MSFNGLACLVSVLLVCLAAKQAEAVWELALQITACVPDGAGITCADGDPGYEGYDHSIWTSAELVSGETGGTGGGERSKYSAFNEASDAIKVDFTYNGQTNSVEWTHGLGKSLQEIFSVGGQSSYNDQTIIDPTSYESDVSYETTWRNILGDGVAPYQNYCNKQGFNVQANYACWARFGNIMNQEGDCNSPDVSVGLGLNHRTQQVGAGAGCNCCQNGGSSCAYMRGDASIYVDVEVFSCSSGLSVDNEKSNSCSDGDAIGTTCSYTCNAGYYASGTHSCTTDGTFSGGSCATCSTCPPGQGHASGCSGPDCMDDEGFTDAQGFYCADWSGYDCEDAAEAWGYSVEEELDILENCKYTCNYCEDSSSDTSCESCSSGSTYSDVDDWSSTCKTCSACAAGDGVTSTCTTTTDTVCDSCDSYCGEPVCDGCYNANGPNECWGLCSGDRGYCSACDSANGAPGACCMYGDQGDPTECQGVPEERYVALGYHQCVIVTCDAYYSDVNDQSSCKACSTCAAGDGVTSACTATSDTQCSGCSSGSTYSDVNDQSSCKACSTCAAGYEPTSACTPTSDTVCGECSSGDTYSDVDDQSSCKACSTCATGQGATSACTTTSDTECGECSSGDTYSDVDDQSSCKACSSCTDYCIGDQIEQLQAENDALATKAGGDLNEDGSINVLDAVVLINLILS